MTWRGMRGEGRGAAWSDGVGVRRTGPRVSAPGIPRVLASLARAPFAGSERGRTWCTPLSCARKGRERNERGMRGDGKGLGACDVEVEGIEGGVAADVEGFAVLVAEGAVGGALFGY